MNNKFDELTKGLAQSVTRRGALKKFSVGLAGMALACFGLANKAVAGGCAGYGKRCTTNSDCCSGVCSQFGTCFCATDGDCNGREVCLSTGVCRRRCILHRDCPARQLCFNGICGSGEF